MTNRGWFTRWLGMVLIFTLILGYTGFSIVDGMYAASIEKQSSVKEQPDHDGEQAGSDAVEAGDQVTDKDASAQEEENVTGPDDNDTADGVNDHTSEATENTNSQESQEQPPDPDGQEPADSTGNMNAENSNTEGGEEAPDPEQSTDQEDPQTGSSEERDELSGSEMEQLNNETSLSSTKTISCEIGKSYHFTFLASAIADYTNKQFQLTYDATKLEVADFSAQTKAADTSVGTIEGGCIEILSHTSGMMVFQVNKSLPSTYTWKSQLNIFKFRAIAAGSATISVAALGN